MVLVVDCINDGTETGNREENVFFSSVQSVACPNTTFLNVFYDILLCSRKNMTIRCKSVHSAAWAILLTKAEKEESSQ